MFKGCQCFQVNYWLDGDDEPVYKQYIRYEGQVSEGIVIGLFPDTNFWFEVQVFNTAGLGPLSEKFIQETLHEGMENNLSTYFIIFNCNAVERKRDNSPEVYWCYIVN